jgi:hypothetical protein
MLQTKQDHFSQAGFELLEALGQHQNNAYQKLFTWVQNRCQDSAAIQDSSSNSGVNDAVEDVTLQMAIRYLYDIPQYFSQCQDLVITSRRSLLVARFVTALSSHNLHYTHNQLRKDQLDPAARFIGDMLAWMHQVDY